MKKTIFEQMGGTYTKVGDYYLPNLLLAEKEQKSACGGSGTYGTLSSTEKCYIPIC